MLQSVLEARCKALQSENISHQRWSLQLLSRSWHKNTSKHDAKTDAEPKNDASRNYLNWVLHYMHVFHVPSVFYFVYFWPFFHHMTSQIWICAMPQNIRDSREIPEIAHALTTRVGLDLSYMVHDDGFFLLLLHLYDKITIRDMADRTWSFTAGTECNSWAPDVIYKIIFKTSRSTAKFPENELHYP